MTIMDRKEKGRKAKVLGRKVKMESCVCGWVGSGQTWWKEGKGVKKCNKTGRTHPGIKKTNLNPQGDSSRMNKRCG